MTDGTLAALFVLYSISMFRILTGRLEFECDFIDPTLNGRNGLRGGRVSALA